MNPETEQIFATLELLLEHNLPLELPGHEDGSHIYPFVWDVSEQGKFSILNLCRYNSWLKFTDVDATIKSWQELEYAKYFSDLDLNSTKIEVWANQIESLFQVLNKEIDSLESYLINPQYPYVTSPGIVLGKIEDNNWICVSPTVYKETNIPQEIIARSPLENSMSDRSSSINTPNVIAKINDILSNLEVISLNGDFGGGYYYSYDHQITYAVAETRELALEQALQASGMLEISQFNGFCRDRQYLQDWYCNYDIQKLSQNCEKVNQFLNQNFSRVFIYRISFWSDENIYIVGKTSSEDLVGIYINSQFVYNP
jgi:hypothetical protein